MLKWLRNSLMKKAEQLLNKALLIFIEKYFETLAILLASYTVYCILNQ